mgnify:CR=1 FL=1
MAERTKTIRKLERRIMKSSGDADTIAKLIRDSFRRPSDCGLGKIDEESIGNSYLYLMLSLGLIEDSSETEPGYYDNGIFVRGDGHVIHKLTKKAKDLYKHLKAEGYYKK